MIKIPRLIIFSQSSKWPDSLNEVSTVNKKRLGQNTLHKHCWNLEKEKKTSYYNEKEDEFLVLRYMARDCFAIPAMSAPAEALFCRIGKIVRKTHNRLSTDTVKQLTTLKLRSIIPHDSSSGAQFNLDNI